MIVGPIHPKAMPVMLTTAEEFDVWLHAPWAQASTLQRPLPDRMMRIVAAGGKDRHPESAERKLIRFARQRDLMTFSCP